MNKPTKHYYDYEIVWEKVITTNPALDFNNPEAMVSIPIFTDVTTMEKETNMEVETQRKRVNWIINDQREKFVATKGQLYERGIYSETLPCVKHQRWSLESIQQFLDGKTTQIDIKTLYEDIKRKWEEKIEFPDQRLYHLFTIWTMGTYLFPLFHCYPYLYLTGLKDTGKTKVLEVAKQLCFNAKLSASITGSALFRFVQGTRCTLLMDETEKLQYREGSSKTTERAAEIRALLLAGYKKGGTATRSEKPTQQGTYEPTEFECYSPKIIANIGGIEDVLESRCIQVIMLRTIDKKISESEVNAREKTWQQIRDNLYLMMMLHWREVKGVHDGYVNTTDLTTRQYELWKPIFVLAAWLESHGVIFSGEGLRLESEGSVVSVGHSGISIIENLASETSLEIKVEEGAERWENLLLQSLLLQIKEDGWVSAKTVTSYFKETMGIKSERCSSSWVGKALKRIGFRKKRRVGSGVEYYFTVNEIEERVKRYGFSVEDIKKSFSLDAVSPTLTTQPSLYERKDSEPSEVKELPFTSPTPPTTPVEPVKSEPSEVNEKPYTTQGSLATLKIEKIIDTLSTLEHENPYQPGYPIAEISQQSGLRIGIVEPILHKLREQGTVEERESGIWARTSYTPREKKKQPEEEVTEKMKEVKPKPPQPKKEEETPLPLTNTETKILTFVEGRQPIFKSDILVEFVSSTKGHKFSDIDDTIRKLLGRGFLIDNGKGLLSKTDRS